MRLLISADYKAKNSGNFIASLLALTRYMNSLGNTVYFAFPKTEKDYSWAEKLERTSNTDIIYVSYAQSKSADYVKELIKKNQIDLIHDHFSFFRHCILHNPKEFKGTKVLIHDHMGFVENKPSMKEIIRNIGIGLLCTKYRFGIASVSASKNRSYWTACKRHWYVPNGLSMERNVLNSLEPSECRHMLGIEEEKLVLILGWDMHRKGLDIAIKAVELVRHDDSHVILGIVGCGINPSEQLRMWIKNTTGIDSSEPWIRFLESTEDIFSYLRATDVCLSASRSEGFNYSIIEAISQRTPCVISDIDAQLWAKEYSNAVFFHNEDYMDCADKIKKALILKREDANSEMLLDRYSVDKWSKNISDIYRILLSN